MSSATTLIMVSTLCTQTAATVQSGGVGYLPPDCGTNALFVLMALNGGEADLDRIRSALPAPHELGYSMLELRSAARRCGLNLIGETFRPTNVPLRGPVIAYRPGHKPASGHFVVLRPVGSHNTVVQIIDPPYAPRIVEYAVLFGRRGEPIRILRSATVFESWVPIGAAILLAATCVAGLVLASRVRRRAKPLALSADTFVEAPRLGEPFSGR